MAESRVAGVAAVELGGRPGGLEYSLRPGIAVGTEVTRAASTLFLRLRRADGWLFSLEPRAEYLRDVGFDMLRRQTLFAATARARRSLGVAREDVLDLRVGGELLDTPGSAEPFLLAHRVASAGVGWDHEPLLGTSWSARYGAAVRNSPDSSVRDHLEHQLVGTLRQEFGGGHSLELDAELARRGTLRDVPGTRDRFAELGADLRGTARLGGPYSLLGPAGTELHRYDQPDSVLDFDYHVERVRIELRRETGRGPDRRAGAARGVPCRPVDALRALRRARVLVAVRARRRPAHLLELGIRRHDRPGGAAFVLHFRRAAAARRPGTAREAASARDARGPAGAPRRPVTGFAGLLLLRGPP